jgi:hypothetical protein
MPTPRRLTAKHLLRSRSATVLLAAALLACATSARAGATPEQVCQRRLALAANRWARCETAIVNLIERQGALGAADGRRTSRCGVQLLQVWPKLQAKAAGTGSTCDQPRYADGGDGTVIDRLTGLQWEQKTNLDGTSNLADPHDADNDYTWSASSTSPDGTVFTDFLPALDSGSCFAGHCDWRVPTMGELLSIQPFGVLPVGCLDPAFGPTPCDFRGHYVSATPVLPLDYQNFEVGLSQIGLIGRTDGVATRAVRSLLP